MKVANINGRSKAKQQKIAEIVELERKLSARKHHVSEHHWMSLGLTTVQLKSLFYIVRNSDANSKKLSVILNVTPANVTGVIDRLVERGMVRRMESTKDRRITLLRATVKGKKLIGSLEANVVEHITKLMLSLKEEDLNHLSLGLTAYIEAWDKLHKDKKIE